MKRFLAALGYGFIFTFVLHCLFLGMASKYSWVDGIFIAVTNLASGPLGSEYSLMTYSILAIGTATAYHYLKQGAVKRWGSTIAKCSSCGTKYTLGRNSRCPNCGSDVYTY